MIEAEQYEFCEPRNITILHSDSNINQAYETKWKDWLLVF